ncbi:MAG: hypothetical protein ACREAU_01250 [Nitrosopumilaceae archaeon]
MLDKRQAVVIGISIAAVTYFLYDIDRITHDPDNQADSVQVVIPSIDDCEDSGDFFLCVQPPFNGRAFATEEDVLAAIKQVKEGTYEPYIYSPDSNDKANLERMRGETEVVKNHHH